RQTRHPVWALCKGCSCKDNLDRVENQEFITRDIAENQLTTMKILHKQGKPLINPIGINSESIESVKWCGYYHWWIE
ncbi:hypothetical protein J6590_098054, partial [Homalodisca vitripennis]